MIVGNESTEPLVTVEMPHPLAQSAAPIVVVANVTNDVMREVLYQRATVCEPMSTQQPATAVQGMMSTECIVASGSVDVVPSVSVAGSTTLTGTGAVDDWMRDAHMVETIFQIIEGMEPPWVTLNVLEVAAVRFPNVDPEVLRHTIMTVMMTQRQCIVRVTRAGLRLGPCTDRDGNAFIELDLDFADRFSWSH